MSDDGKRELADAYEAALAEEREKELRAKLEAQAAEDAAMRAEATKSAPVGDVTDPLPIGGGNPDAVAAALGDDPDVRIERSERPATAEETAVALAILEKAKAEATMPPEPKFPDVVPPPKRREPRIPIPAPERGGTQGDIAQGIVQHASRVKPADLPDGEPGAPVFYRGHPRWGWGGAAGGPVVQTLCPGCPKAVGVPPNHTCSGSVSVDTLRGPNADKFLVCPSFPSRRALPVMS